MGLFTKRKKAHQLDDHGKQIISNVEMSMHQDRRGEPIVIQNLREHKQLLEAYKIRIDARVEDLEYRIESIELAMTQDGVAVRPQSAAQNKKNLAILKKELQSSQADQVTCHDKYGEISHAVTSYLSSYERSKTSLSNQFPRSQVMKNAKKVSDGLKTFMHQQYSNLTRATARIAAMVVNPNGRFAMLFLSAQTRAVMHLNQCRTQLEAMSQFQSHGKVADNLLKSIVPAREELNRTLQNTAKNLLATVTTASDQITLNQDSVVQDQKMTYEAFRALAHLTGDQQGLEGIEHTDEFEQCQETLKEIEQELGVEMTEEPNPGVISTYS